MSHIALCITRIDHWRRANGWTTEELGRNLGVSQPSAWRYCTPSSDPQHRTPRKSVAMRLRELSEGAVHAGNYADLIDPTVNASIDTNTDKETAHDEIKTSR